MICVNNEHPLKTSFPISVTEGGIVICVNVLHSCEIMNPFGFFDLLIMYPISFGK